MGDNFTKLPTFVEGEYMLLGYMLVNPDIINEVAQQLLPVAFSNQKCQVIFETITRNSGTEFGLLLQLIKEATGDNEIGIQLEENIRAIQDEIPYTEYVEKLKDVYLRRKLIVDGQELIKNATDNNIPASQSSAQFIASIINVQSNAKTIIESKDIWKRRVSGFNKRRVKGRLLSGLPSLDQYLTEGFAAGTTSLIAARPSMGKSTFKRRLIDNLCSDGRGVFNVLTETGFDREQDCIDAMRTGRPITHFFKPSQWDDEFKRQIKASNVFIAENWNYTVQEERFYSYAALERDIMMLMQTRQIDVVFIDLFDRLLEVAEARAKEKTYVIKRILQNQAAFAEKMGIHICNIGQIHRFDSKSSGKKRAIPRMEDIAESGAFEQITDLILLLYRPGYYDDTIEDDELQVILEKQRIGVRNKTIQLFAEWECLRLEDVG